MTATASMGHQAQLGIKKETTYGTAVTVDTRLNFVSESLKKTGVILEREAIRGFRDHVSSDTRTGPYSVGGQIVLEPTPEDLAILFPLILGADASGTDFDLAETLPSFTTVVDRVAKVFTYAGCVVNRATFAGSQGGYLRLGLELVAKSEAAPGNAGTFPALTASVTTPYIFNGDVTLTLAGTAKKCRSFELTIDNALVTDRFYNDTTIVSAPPGDRVVTLRTEHAFSAGTGATGNTDLYALALGGVSGSLAFATGNYSTTFTFGVLQIPDNSPTVPSKAEIMLSLEMVARRSGSTPSIDVSHDSNGAS